MGLIKNALLQGQQALEAIAKAGVKRPGALDVLIVGAGPAGLAASLAAKKMGLSYQTIEQDSLGGAVFQYPRGKLVMTAPVELPIIGKVQFRNTSKEDSAEILDRCLQGNELKIRYQERVESIENKDGVFHVNAGRQQLPRRGGVAGDRPARHAAQTRRAGRRAAESRLSVDRSRAIPRPEGSRGRRRRQRARGGGQHRRTRRHPWCCRTAARLFSAPSSAIASASRRPAAKGRLNVLLNSQIREIRPNEVLLKQAGQGHEDEQ